MSGDGFIHPCPVMHPFMWLNTIFRGCRHIWWFKIEVLHALSEIVGHTREANSSNLWTSKLVKTLNNGGSLCTWMRMIVAPHCGWQSLGHLPPIRWHWMSGKRCKKPSSFCRLSKCLPPTLARSHHPYPFPNCHCSLQRAHNPCLKIGKMVWFVMMWIGKVPIS